MRSRRRDRLVMDDQPGIGAGLFAPVKRCSAPQGRITVSFPARSDRAIARRKRMLRVGFPDGERGGEIMDMRVFLSVAIQRGLIPSGGGSGRGW